MFKRKRCNYFVLAVLFASYSLAQFRSVDSLKLLIPQQKNSAMKLELMKEIGTQCVENGYYKDGITWYFNALKIAEEKKDTISLAALCNNIAVIYTETDQNKKSFAFAQKAVNLALRRKNVGILGDAYNSLGNSYYMDFQDSLALIYFDKSLEYRIKAGDSLKTSVSIKNLAAVYNEFGDTKKALELTHLAAAYRLNKSDKDDKLSLYVALSDLQFKIDRFDSAEFYIKKAKEFVSGARNLYQIKSYYESNLQINKHRKNYEEAIEDLSALIRIKDSILNKDTHKNMAELQAKYETDKKELEIRAKNAELNEQKQARSLSTILFTGIILLLIITITFIRIRVRSKQKLKDELERIERENLMKKTELETKEKERNRISAELHDNVGSSVSFISAKIDWLMRHGSFKEEQRSELASLKDSSQEVMSGLRETLWTLNSKSISNIDLCDKLKVYIKKHLLCPHVFKDELVFEYILPNEDVLAIYRCSQEIINNVNKHSNANKVEIGFFSSDKVKLKVWVYDDGIGMIEEKKNGSYGLRNIRTRLTQIGANLEINCEPGAGTQIIITYF